MTRLIFYTHQWLLVSLIYLLAGCGLPTLDLAVHDSYFVIDGFQVGICGALLFGGMWLFYWLIPALRTLVILSKIHLVLTSIWGLSLLFLISFPRSNLTRYTDYTVYSGLTTNSFTIDYFINLLLLLFLVIQVIWIVQLVAFIIKRLKY